MKTVLLFFATITLVASCQSNKVEVIVPKIEEPVFDSSLVQPLSDSVASLYRKQ